MRTNHQAHTPEAAPLDAPAEYDALKAMRLCVDSLLDSITTYRELLALETRRNAELRRAIHCVSSLLDRYEQDVERDAVVADARRVILRALYVRDCAEVGRG